MYWLLLSSVADLDVFDYVDCVMCVGCVLRCCCPRLRLQTHRHILFTYRVAGVTSVALVVSQLLSGDLCIRGRLSSGERHFIIRVGVML